MDKTQQNGNYRLCWDSDEAVDHIISECSKPVQKEYKTWYNWVRKRIGPTIETWP